MAISYSVRTKSIHVSVALPYLPERVIQDININLNIQTTHQCVLNLHQSIPERT